MVEADGSAFGEAGGGWESNTPVDLFTDNPYLDTGRVKASRRLRMFEEAYSETISPCRFMAYTDEFQSRSEVLQLGTVGLALTEGSASGMEATLADVQSADPVLLLDVINRGRGFMRQQGRQVDVKPGDAMLFNSEIPWACGAAESYLVHSVLIRGTQVADRLGDLERIGSGVIPASTPELILLRDYISAIRFGDDAPDPATCAMIGGHLLDLTVSAIARVMGVDDPTGGNGARAVRFAQVRRLIASELHSPTLNAQAVARRLNLSSRYVNKLFETIGTTCSDYIMEKRLQTAYRLLCSADERSVQEIAWSLGFSEPSHFTRAFRRRYGETPTAVRRGPVTRAVLTSHDVRPGGLASGRPGESVTTA